MAQLIGTPSNPRADLHRMLRWIALSGAVLVVLALWYISLFGPLNLVNVTATIAGVFLSVLLGCGLFSLAFYSSKSGHDERSRAATSGFQSGSSPDAARASFTSTLTGSRPRP